MSTWYIIPSDSDIMHYGVKGMKWHQKKKRSTTDADNALRNKIAKPTKSGNPGRKNFDLSRLSSLPSSDRSLIASYLRGQWGARGSKTYKGAVSAYALGLRNGRPQQRAKVLKELKKIAPQLYYDVMTILRRNSSGKKTPVTDTNPAYGSTTRRKIHLKGRS